MQYALSIKRQVFEIEIHTIWIFYWHAKTYKDYTW